jgi:hypothetical protein
MSSSNELNLPIASTCLAVLAFDDVEDCQQPLNLFNVFEFQTKMAKHTDTRLINYALDNWIDHVSNLVKSRECVLGS